MKIALLITGHVRHIEKTAKSQIKNFIRIVNPDIFMTTWDKTNVEEVGIRLERLGPIGRIENLNYKKHIERYYGKWLTGVQIYNYSKLSRIVKEEKKQLLDSVNEDFRDDVERILTQYLLVHYGFKSIMIPSKYDIIIRIRPDMFIKDMFDINKFDVVLKKNRLLKHKDRYMIGTFDMMDVALNVWEKLGWPINKISFESLYDSFLRQENIEYEEWSWNFTFVRGNIKTEEVVGSENLDFKPENINKKHLL